MLHRTTHSDMDTATSNAITQTAVLLLREMDQLVAVNHVALPCEAIPWSGFEDISDLAKLVLLVPAA